MDNKERPGYYAVIPAEVRYDDQIPANAKLLYGEISALLNAQGFCFASNGYFAELYGVTEVSVSRLIAKLEKAGHIIREVVRDESGQIVNRKLYLRASMPDVHPLNKNVNTSLQKNQEGINKNVKDTNLSNTVYIKEKNKKEKPPKEAASELTLEEMKPLFVENIRKMSQDRSWSADVKNQIYAALIDFYSPRPIKGKKDPPTRSSRGLSGLCNKLMRESRQDPLVILAALDDAIAAGWVTAHPKPRDALQPMAPSAKRGREYEVI